MTKMMHTIIIPPERRFFYSILFIILGTGIIYYNSLQGEFIGDDVTLIENNIFIQDTSVSNIIQIFSRPFFDVMHPSLGRTIGMMGDAYYRPLALLSYVCDYAIWNRIPFGYHLTNVFIHIVSVMLLFVFLYDITHRHGFSFLCASIFMVHPIHARYVSSISGRTDLLCLMFFLLCMVWYGRYIRTGQRRRYFFLVGSVLSFFAALLSKEMAISLPFIIVLYDICFCPEPFQRQWKKRLGLYSIFLLTLLFYFYIRKNVVGMGFGDYLAMGGGPYFYLRIITVADILVSHVLTVLAPFNVYYSWHYVPLATASFGKTFFIFCLVIIIIVCSAIISWYRKREIFFGLGWFCITYFPVSNIIPLYLSIAQHNLFTGEQFMHIPMIGIIIMLGMLVGTCQSFLKNPTHQTILKKVVMWGCIGVILTFSVVTIYYNVAWSNAIYYNMKVLEQIPDSVEAHISLGVAYFKRGAIGRAMTYFTHALRIQEEKSEEIKITPVPYQNLISIHYNVLENYDEVRSLCYRGLNVFPHYYVFYYFLAAVSFKEGNYRQAIAYSKKALSINPTFHACIQSLYKLLGEYSIEEKDRIHRYRQQIQDNPTDARPYFRLARLYQDYYLYERAIAYYKQVLRIDPHFHNARSNLVYCYEQLSLTNKAQEERRKIFLTPL